MDASSLCHSGELSHSIQPAHCDTQGPYVFGAVNWCVPGLAATLREHLVMKPHLVGSADPLVCHGALCHACTLQQDNIIQGVASLLLQPSPFTIFFKARVKVHLMVHPIS